ncbi:hypothetical protein EAS62_38075 [Bradyrhizobium zhanjiangense]|uniref:Uncharacterized protein n=1 Tax=Bradyrhizobium zhanjiangense TaxID=1325107 RepID=A0ABY0D8Z7_9BRAD|nr:hypothetical protein EAS62_38075 [Bradyrhizobium zhanjiangense]
MLRISRLIVLQAPHVLAFSIGMMTDRDFARMPVLEALFVSAPALCARDSVTFEDKRLGASNIGSINVHEITQLDIGVRHGR